MDRLAGEPRTRCLTRSPGPSVIGRYPTMLRATVGSTTRSDTTPWLPRTASGLAAGEASLRFLDEPAVDVVLRRPAARQPGCSPAASVRPRPETTRTSADTQGRERGGNAPDHRPTRVPGFVRASCQAQATEGVVMDWGAGCRNLSGGRGRGGDQRRRGGPKCPGGRSSPGRTPWRPRSSSRGLGSAPRSLRRHDPDEKA